MSDKNLINPESIAEQIHQLGLAIDVVQTDVPEELIALTITELNKTSISFARAGFYLLNLKSTVTHGAFSKALKAHGIDGERAREAMRVAQALLALPADVAKKLVHLPRAKMIELAKISPDHLEQISDAGELDDMAVMTRDELRDYVRSLETKNVNLNQLLEVEHLKQEHLTTLQQKSNLYPEFVEMARHESTALASKAMLCVDDLARLRGELDAIENMQSTHDTGFIRFMNIARASLFHNLRAAAARCNALVNELANEYEPEVTGPVDPVTYFTDDDILISIQERNLLVGEHKHEAVMRQDERNMKKSRKPRKAGKSK